MISKKSANGFKNAVNNFHLFGNKKNLLRVFFPCFQKCNIIRYSFFVFLNGFPAKGNIVFNPPANGKCGSGMSGEVWIPFADIPPSFPHHLLVLRQFHKVRRCRFGVLVAGLLEQVLRVEQVGEYRYAGVEVILTDFQVFFQRDELPEIAFGGEQDLVFGYLLLQPADFLAKATARVVFGKSKTFANSHS
jgi:hypothetical protein